jgi:2Fe-2S ferredoxin
MPILSFSKTHKASLRIDSGENLMQALLKGGNPVASSCHGDGVCAKCRITINKGMENLSVINDTEKFLREKFQLEKNQRISCQTFVNGDVEVDASYW